MNDCKVLNKGYVVYTELLIWYSVTQSARKHQLSEPRGGASEQRRTEELTLTNPNPAKKKRQLVNMKWKIKSHFIYSQDSHFCKRNMLDFWNVALLHSFSCHTTIENSSLPVLGRRLYSFCSAQKPSVWCQLLPSCSSPLAPPPLLLLLRVTDMLRLLLFLPNYRTFSSFTHFIHVKCRRHGQSATTSVWGNVS